MKKVMMKPVLSSLVGLVLFVAPLAATQAALSMPADSAKIYRVQGLSAGNVLKMYKEPGGKGVIVNIPHNATWIVRRNAQVEAGGTVWEKVSWGDRQTGWVMSDALTYDPEATKVVAARRACMANPQVKDKECCGYPNAGKGAFHSVPLYKVKGLKAGESLMMYVEKQQDAIAVELPHNATWVAKLGKVAPYGSKSWELVRWAGQNGWVDGSKLKFDPETTAIGDNRRKKCGGYSTGVDFKQSDVVCLPAPVIRRLQESGALDAETISKMKKSQ